MCTQKRAGLCVVFVILSLLLTQSITIHGLAEATGTSTLAHASTSAPYQAFLPLVMRSIFEPSNGVLDPSFDDDGLLVTSLTADSGYGRAIALQPDGKLVVVGSLEVEVDDYAFVVARYHPDGSLDPTFDGDGMVTTNLSPKYDQINDVVLQEDGKILVVGSSEVAGDSDFYLARYNPGGSLDTTFDEDGWLTTDFGGGDDFAYALALQPDGKILAAGAATEPDIPDYLDLALARYHPDGSLDTSFDGDGRVQIFNDNYETGHAISIQKDGKLVVAGTGLFPGIPYYSYYFLLARFNPDGNLDPGFGIDGWVTNDFASGGGSEGISDMLLQIDGKLVAAGYVNNATTGNINFALARYNPDGSLDTSFGVDGLVTTDFSGNDDLGAAVTQQPDGTFLVAGSMEIRNNFNEESVFALARYTPTGSLDTSFDGDGWLITDFTGVEDQCSAMVLQPDGKIVLAGDSEGDFALARYTSKGLLDASFDGDGIVITDLTVHSEGLQAIALQPDGKLVAAGYGWDGISGDQFLVARYTYEGFVDTSFGGRGWVTTNLSPYEDRINDVVLQTDGKILVAGSSATSAQGDFDFALARYNIDGSLDTSFDSDGWLTTDFNGGSDHGQSIALQPDGKIVVAGWVELTDDDRDFALARYNPDGSLDVSFDGDGKVTSDYAGYLDSAFAIALQADGKIVVVGEVSAGWIPWTDFSIALARYTPEGSLDASFDGDGWVVTDFYAGGGPEHGSDLLLQPDGKIVATGWVNNNDTGYKDSVLLRYLPDGSLDASFDGDGWVVNNFFSHDYISEAVHLQPDGNLLVAGYADVSDAPDNESVFVLARYNRDGSLDIDFNADGWLTTDFWGVFDDECHAIDLYPDGKIILAGEAGGDFALARYE